MVFEVFRLQKWSKNCQKPGQIVFERVFFRLLEISNWPNITVVWKVPDTYNSLLFIHPFSFKYFDYRNLRNDFFRVPKKRNKENEENNIR